MTFSSEELWDFLHGEIVAGQLKNGEIVEENYKNHCMSISISTKCHFFDDFNGGIRMYGLNVFLH